MSSDRRHNWGMIIDVLNVLEQHGYRQADDQLDIPGYRPEYGWKPATGTGVAPEIRPRAGRGRRNRR